MTWASLQARILADVKSSRGEGRNFTVIGPKGSGKTHISLALAEMFAYILVLATKRVDPLVSELQADGYHVTADLTSMPWADSDRARRPVPVNGKVVFWPRGSEKMTAHQRISYQAGAMSAAMDWADKTGGWAVVLDETIWMQDRLRLDAEMDSLWHQGRTAGLSVLANAQRPARVPRLAFSQADYLFMAKFTDKRDLETLRDISSNIPPQIIETALLRLNKDAHEFLFIDTSKDHAAIVVAPPR